LLFESRRYADYLKAPTQRRFWLASCRNGRKARTTVPPADAKFLDEMRKMLDLRNRWAWLAGLPAIEQIAVRHSSEQNEQQDQDSSELELRPRPHDGSAGRRRSAAALLATVPAPI
jgi:hypothetical protein